MTLSQYIHALSRIWTHALSFQAIKAFASDCAADGTGLGCGNRRNSSRDYVCHLSDRNRDIFIMTVPPITVYRQSQNVCSLLPGHRVEYIQEKYAKYIKNNLTIN
jgi:hypothetical protein